MFFILDFFTKYERVCLTKVRHGRVIWSSKIPYGDRPRCEVHRHLRGGHGLGSVRSAPLSLYMARHASQMSLVRVSGWRKWKWSRVTGTAWPVWGEVSVAGRGAWHARGQHDSGAKRLCDTFWRLILFQILWFEVQSCSVVCRRLARLSWAQLFLLYVLSEAESTLVSSVATLCLNTIVLISFTPCSVTCTHQHISDCEYTLS